MQKISLFIKYAVVGGLTTILELAILYSLTEHRHLWYVYSSIVAYAVGFTVSFFMRKLWAFKDFNFENTGKQFFAYVIILSGTLILNTFLLVLLVEKILMRYLWAQFVAGLLIGWVGFFINEKVTFKSDK